MYKRFEESIPSVGWDTIVIGSGPAGLCAAAVLARSGQKVIVLEKHYEPGGFSHTFKRKEFEWDVGVHYIGGVHREGTVENRVFDYISEKRLKWEPMGRVYDRAEIDGTFYDFVDDLDDQIDLWISYFPEEEDAIRKYWQLVRECAYASRNYFAERAAPPLISATAGSFMKRKFQKFSDRLTYDVLSELTNNQTLIEVLCAQLGDYGLPPNQSSFGMHAMLVNHYRKGGAYPIGGASRIATTIIETIEKRGGAVVLRAGAESLIIENGRAVGVKIESGEEIRGTHVISSIGVVNTIKRLCPDEKMKGINLEQDTKKVGSSLAHLCLYLGLDQSDEQLKLPRFNYWCYDPYRGDHKPGGRLTTAYISFPSAKDPEWCVNHGDTATVQCIGPCHYEDFEQWADTRWKKRGEEYEAAKEKFKEKMLKILLRLHPEIEGHIAWAEVSSPLSTKHFSFYERGEIYGLEHTPERFRLKWLRPRTSIPGLYFSGQDICTAGITGALMSGLLTTSAMMNKNMVESIMKGEAP